MGFLRAWTHVDSIRRASHAGAASSYTAGPTAGVAPTRAAPAGAAPARAAPARAALAGVAFAGATSAGAPPAFSAAESILRPASATPAPEAG